jgi:hypothetical protein
MWLGYAQSEVVALAAPEGPTLKTYSDWENGRHQPQMGKGFRAVAEVLRQPPGWFLFGEKGDPRANNGIQNHDSSARREHRVLPDLSRR